MTRKERQRKYLRAWKRANPEKVREYARKRAKTAAFKKYQSAWRKARLRGPHGDAVRAAKRARYHRNREEIIARRRGGRAGLSSAEFKAMVRKHRGKCAVCRVLMGKICVDHDHATGRVRGLLCTGCNTFAGYLEKRGKMLKTMLQYLKAVRP